MTQVRIGHNSGDGFIEDDRVLASEAGFTFQFRFVRAILERLSGFSSVVLTDLNGNVFTLQNYERRGRDGGLDLVIRIEAKSTGAAKRIARLVRTIVLEIEI